MMDMKRYHPFSIIFDLANFVKNFAILVFFAVVNVGSDSGIARMGQILFLVSLVLSIIASVMKWLTRKYAVDEFAFHLKTGIFEKTERTVYFDKIQNVRRNTSFLHKLFGMTSITFETGTSGMNSNVKFDVLKRSEANRLETLVKEFIQPGDATTESEDETAPMIGDRIVHFTPTRKDTIKASFTSFSFLIILAIGVSLFSKLDKLYDVENYLGGWFVSVLTSAWIIAGFIVGLLVLAVTVGVIWTFVKYGNYEIASDGERIYISKGVLDETTFSIAKKRVQAVEITQSFMKRIFGLAEVKLISAGDLGDGEDEVSSLYPFLPVKRAYAMIAELLPDYQVVPDAERLPRQSLMARLIKPYWFWGIVTILLAYFRPEVFKLHIGWAIVSITFLVLLILSRVLGYWNTSYAVKGRFIQLSQGTFEKTTFLTRRDKIIEISVKRTKLQQWFGLATIGLINRAKPLRHETLPDMPIKEAQQFVKWYAERTKNVQLK
ncbi:PH domain-containing protein [Sporosarcina aquimarina]|uniref:PH domain-containing protein n=1 Tax=Sporosarcina aquimarina TaxID=114975 RepID=UPI002040EC27|nr:PH domain-containing protein [Sporosarcina aquimarina]MCM3756177.1 PH domain-containing protein [Sporosarcina aquimarina]